MSRRTYTQLLGLHGVSHIAELRRRMDEEAYQRSNGSYSGMPTWGPETARVEELIASGGPHGDLVSWDTRADDVSDHRYLIREADGAHSRFALVVERDLEVLS